MDLMKRLAGLVVLSVLGVGGYWLWDNRTVEVAHVDTVSPEELDALLGRDGSTIDLGTTNVVLAVVCTLRKDRLEPYGHGKPTSPFLRVLANRSVLLERHFTQAPWTRPSMGSLFTGIWPRALQLDNPGPRGSLSMVLQEQHQTLAEALKAEGYRTIGSTGNPNLKGQFGLAQGLETSWEPSSTYAEDQLKIDGFAQVDFLLNELDETPAEQPAYLRLVLTDSHQPRQTETRYMNLFAKRGTKHPGRRAKYDASVRKVDAILAQLYRGVITRRPNTLFVVASDHGEGLRHPDHHGKGHGNHLYETHIASPSIWNHPSLKAYRFKGLTMNLDVKPTIMGLLGKEKAPGVDGRDLSATLEGRGEWTGYPYVFSETFYGRSNKATVISPTHQLVRRQRKNKRPTILQTLHAVEDRLSEYDLIAKEPEVAAELENRLDQWLKEMSQRNDAAGTPESTTLSPELQLQLEALGYLE
jgi:arylsulfatase A-like enzyme